MGRTGRLIAKAFDPVLDWLRGGDSSQYGSQLMLPRTNFNYEGEVGDGLGSNVLMSPVAWIQRNLVQAPFCISKRKGAELEEIPGHRVESLIRNPNPYYSGKDLWQATVLSWIWGEAYWLKIRKGGQGPWNLNVSGEPEQIWWIPNWLLSPEGNERTFISHYEYKPTTAAPIKVAVENVIHFRNGIDPRNLRHGLSMVYPVLREIFTDDEAANFAASLCRNSGVGGLVISPKGDGVIVDDVEAVKAYFDQNFTGDKRGRTVVMSGATEIQQYGFSPQQMDFGSIRDIPEERICAALGLPASVVGFGTGIQQTKVGATMAEQRRMAWEDCIIPMQSAFAQTVEHRLLTEFESQPENFRAAFDVSDVSAMRENQTEVATKFNTAITGGWALVSDGRRALGLEVSPADEVYLRNISVIEVPYGDSMALPMSPATPKRLKDASPVESRIIEHAPSGRATREQRALIARLFREAVHLEVSIDDDLQHFFRKFGQQLADAAKDLLAVLAPKSRTAERKDDDDEALVESILNSIDIDILKKELGEIAGAHYVRVAKAVNSALAEVIGLAVDLPDTRAARLIAEGGRRMGLIDLTAQTRARLFSELSAGRSAGEGPVELTRRIRDLVPAGPWSTPRTRARVIARTETLNAQRFSQLEAYRAAENVSSAMVFDNLTGYGDEECAELAGKIVSLEDAEQLMNDEHPNGTRSFAPVVN